MRRIKEKLLEVCLFNYRSFIFPTCLLTIFSLTSSFAAEYQGIWTSGLGIVSYSITEKESTLEQTDTSVQANSVAAKESASVSATSLFVNYEFGQKKRRSYFFKAVAPLISSGGTGTYLGGLGMNFFYNSQPAGYKFQNSGTALYVIPKYRIYYGASLGAGNMVYNTTSAKKTDTFLELSAHGAGSYNYNTKWGGFAKAAVSKTFGIATDAFGFMFFLGATYTGGF